jgi:hypothetical protein
LEVEGRTVVGGYEFYFFGAVGDEDDGRGHFGGGLGRLKLIMVWRIGKWKGNGIDVIVVVKPHLG